MRRTFFAAVLALVCITVVGVWLANGSSSRPSHRIITVGSAPISVVVADTPETRARGLGGRDELGPGEGMLFVFPQTGVYRFWMKDMRFAIDMLWIDERGSIVGWYESVDPSSYPQTFAPKEPARFVLELPAGSVTRLHIQRGMRVAGL